MSNEAMILKCDAGGRMLVPVERQVELVQEFEHSGCSCPRFATWRKKHGTLPARRRSSVPPPSLWMLMEAVVESGC